MPRTGGKTAGKTESSLKEFRTLFPYLKRYRFKYAMGFFCLLTVDAAQVIIPQFMRKAVDIISSGSFVMKDVITPALFMVGLMGIVALGRFSWRFFIHGSARRIEAELRQNLFDHLLSLSYDFYQKNKIGDLMARATNDLNAVRESIGMGLVALVDGSVMAVAILVIIFVQDPGTAVWAVLPLPLITVLILFFGRTVGKRFRKAHETYSAMSDVVQEAFAGVRVIKSFVKEWWFIKKFTRSNDDYRDANMGLVRLFGFFFPFISFLSGITVVIVLLAGGIRVTQGLMSAGSLVALFKYLQMLIWPLMGAGFVVNMIQRGAVSLSRVNEIMKAVPSIRNEGSLNKAARNANPGSTLIEIKNLSFEYIAGKKVLDDISLSVKKGSVLGILGRTGSGKTTLIKAITRMIEPPPGTVFIEGVESAAWDLTALRKLFGVSPQDSYLFSDSIKNNINYSLEPNDSPDENSEQVSEETLRYAATLAGLEKDLTIFNKGWDTLIGERGLTLSGGQKQRTAIARSLVALLACNREILVFDDSLSSVDSETEKLILDGLFDLRREDGGPTIIIISHRVSALSRADQVIVLEKGKITEQGTPAKLSAPGSYFARIAALQNFKEEHNSSDEQISSGEQSSSPEGNNG